MIVSSKSVPQRYFDEEGYHDTISFSTPKQEESNKDSVNFKYTNDDPVRPNNVSQYIGFNEINGAISSDQSDARPPTVVEVEKGTIYNILSTKDLLIHSSCGQDYYSRFIKQFPDNFLHRGQVTEVKELKRIHFKTQITGWMIYFLDERVLFQRQ